jgi:hypothetical protein
MDLVVTKGSRAAADDAAARLRQAGFLARSVCRGKSLLVIVDCLVDDHREVLERVARED